METTIWGSHAWMILHTICFNYPKKQSFNDKQNIKQYISSFINVIPCETCKSSFREIYGRLPINEFINDRYGVFLWSYIVHDLVNQKLNKISPEFENVVKFHISMMNQPDVIDGKKYVDKTFVKYDKYSQGLNYSDLMKKRKNIDINYTYVLVMVLMISIILNCYLLLNKKPNRNARGSRILLT